MESPCGANADGADAHAHAAKAEGAAADSPDVTVCFVLLPVRANATLTLPKGLWDPALALALLLPMLDADVYAPEHHEFVYARADTGEAIGGVNGATDAPLVITCAAAAELIVTAHYRQTLKGHIAERSRPISREEQALIAGYPQHDGPNGEANEKWLASRVCKVTGSTVGAVYGVNPYSSPNRQLKEWLWNTFKGNAACRWGNDHEDDCEEAFREWQTARLLDSETDGHGFVLSDVALEHKGLCICRKLPFLAMSPDGFLRETWQKRSVHGTSREAETAANAAPATVQNDCPRPVPVTRTIVDEGDGRFVLLLAYELVILVEYKCPYGQRYRTTWTGDEDCYPTKDVKKAPGVRLPVPSYYYSQVQYGCRTLGIQDDLLTWPTHCWVVVWNPYYNREADWPDFKTAVSGEGKALTVATRSGTIQATRVDFNAAYAKDLEECVVQFWHEKYMPAVWLKDNGLLAENTIPGGKPPRRKRAPGGGTSRAPKRQRGTADDDAATFLDLDAPKKACSKSKAGFANKYISIRNLDALRPRAANDGGGGDDAEDISSDLDDFDGFVCM
jgi:hypothetical protein